MHNIMKAKKLISMFALLVGAATLLTACNIQIDGNNTKKIVPEGTPIKETREITAFHSMDISHNFAVTYLAGTPTNEITIEAAPNLMEYIETEVKNGELFIRMKKGFQTTNGNLRVKVGSATLRNLDISGACSFTTEGELTGDHLEVDASGAVALSLNAHLRSIEVDCSGAVALDLKGSADKASIDLSGAVACDAKQFEVKNAEIEVSGTASMDINASESVTGSVSGAAAVTNHGAATHESVSTSGASTYRKAY